ncbi:hypothetical protein ABIE85_008820 [Bradyrhizobium diazoefficiens]|jgi:hypothetical protein|uniref:hypothetical protein n=1 Tax=Bradyrhizobium TaxID=374 RepID=UPI00272D169A|nr:hypothetical protein [Bradyrhizobium diazoefficiens]WLA58962.1 hypothetical protein QIH81_09930 [Bradyrhizobium diazoefficiens]
MATDVNSIIKQILDAASQRGGETWDKIKSGAPLYTKAYAQSLADIAEAVASGDMSVADGEAHAQTARLLLIQGFAFSSQVVLYEVQKFIDGVIQTLKDAINSKLPIALL